MSRWMLPVLVTVVVALIVLLSYSPKARREDRAPGGGSPVKTVEDAGGTSSPAVAGTGTATDRLDEKGGRAEENPNARTEVGYDENLRRLRALTGSPLTRDERERAKLVRMLAADPTLEIDAILDFIADASEGIDFRLAMMDVLAARNSPDAIDALKRLFADRGLDPMIRNRALSEIVRRNDGDTFTFLKMALEGERDYPGRHLIVSGLGEIGDRRSVKTLVDIIHEERDPNLRGHAVDALKHFPGDRLAGDVLVSLVRGDGDVNVRKIAIRSAAARTDDDTRNSLRQILAAEKNAEIRGMIEHVLDH